MPTSTESSAAVDAIDRDIVGHLQRDGRASWQALGAAVGLSANATADRVRRLERLGVITGFTVTVEPAALGRTIRARIAIRLDVRADHDAVLAWMDAEEAITSAVHLSGRWHYEIDVAVADVAALDRFIVALREQRRAVETETRVLLRAIVSREPG